tara:strand:- start:3145 stop:3360 length:216 start_codon:yes stop_codon:yes gene_type:complete
MQKGVELQPDLGRKCVSLVHPVPPLLPISNVPRRPPRKESGAHNGKTSKRQGESQGHLNRQKGELRSGGKS